MKKLLSFSTLAIFVLMLFACGGGGKYADAKKAMENFISATEDFVADLEKADDGKSVAVAINSYAEVMKDVGAEMKALAEKYPEIKDQKNPPEELKAVVKKMEEVMPKMMGAMMKLAKYAEDPDVMAAQKKMQEAMASMGGM
jgi:hypothetical protein